METTLKNPVVISDMKKRIKDIQMAISWREFANMYFQRSSSWFYHKLDDERWKYVLANSLQEMAI